VGKKGRKQTQKKNHPQKKKKGKHTPKNGKRNPPQTNQKKPNKKTTLHNLKETSSKIKKVFQSFLIFLPPFLVRGKKFLKTILPLLVSKRAEITEGKSILFSPGEEGGGKRRLVSPFHW